MKLYFGNAVTTVTTFMIVAPVLTLIGICDRQPEKEEECLEKLACHVRLFFRLVHGNVSGRSDDK